MILRSVCQLAANGISIAAVADLELQASKI